MYAHMLDDVDETDRFLERHKLLKLTQEKIETMNRVVKRLHWLKTKTNYSVKKKKKSPGPGSFTGESYQTLKK